jgi:soluble lytic murein transglycosylase
VKRRASLFLLLLLAGAGALVWIWWDSRLDHSQDAPIAAAAARYGVDPALIKAVVWRESRFNPQARGRVGEVGLMQLRENAAQEWADAERLDSFAHEHCFNPQTNTLAGAWYLRKLLRRYSRVDDPIPYALADYNAGRGNVLKWNSGAAATNSTVFLAQIGFPSTREYIQQVQRRYRKYARS